MIGIRGDLAIITCGAENAEPATCLQQDRNSKEKPERFPTGLPGFFLTKFPTRIIFPTYAGPNRQRDLIASATSRSISFALPRLSFQDQREKKDETMSRNLTQNQIASFDSRVKAAYELGGLLRNTVEIADNVVGATHRFNKMGKGLATRRIDQTDVVPMNITHGNATATLEDWNAAEYTGIFNQQKVNYKEQDKLAKIIANAIGRREDQLILDALDAAATTLTVDTNVGGAGTDLNTAKIRRAAKLLNAKGVPRGKGERTMVVSATGLESLLGDPEATTIDKNLIKALYDGEISHWVGFEFIMMEDRDEGGLPKAAALRTSFAYHKAAAGLAVGINMRTEVNYVPVKTSWLANGIFSAGSVAIDADGIVEITTTEAA